MLIFILLFWWVRASRKTLKHSSHQHRLTETDVTEGQFMCNGCRIPGSGKRYRCGPCNYDMHERCATCPTMLTSFFMHPHHSLTLLVRNPNSADGLRCDVCAESVEGLFYRCNLCNFDLHPLCTQLPQHVRHVKDPDHKLELSRGSPSTCKVCARTCDAWRYRCGICKVDVHMRCVLAPVANNQRAIGPQRNFQHGVPGAYYGPNMDPHGPIMGPPWPNYNYNQQAGQIGRMGIFDLVQNLLTGVMSNIIFGATADFLMDL